MNNIALSVTKAITDLLEQNEKQFRDQQSTQDTQAKLLNRLTTRIESLESKCSELENENAHLKQELAESKNLEKDLAKDLCSIKSDVEKLNVRVAEYGGWVKLITAIASQIQGLNIARDNIESQLSKIDQNQSELADQIQRQQRQIDSALSCRMPVKSPSTSSFFNGNTHSSLSRQRHGSSTPKNKTLYRSLDANDDINELSSHAENLREGVEALNALQQSFEVLRSSSFYSDD